MTKSRRLSIFLPLFILVGWNPYYPEPPAIRPDSDSALHHAEVVIRQYTSEHGPSLPKYRLELRDITSQRVESVLHGKVYKALFIGGEYDQELRREDFFIDKSGVYSLGSSFGGDGVVSFEVCDLCDAHSPEMVYIFQTGSGISSEILRLFNAGSKKYPTGKQMFSAGFFLIYPHSIFLRRTPLKLEIWTNVKAWPENIFFSENFIRIGFLECNGPNNSVAIRFVDEYDIVDYLLW